jgi:UDP-2,4-diacetamido-2,4,6-trideoxy-beta-L-altropyranose hydrolase
LDQNFYEHLESRYAGLLREDTIQLLGPKYAVLRQEFVFWRQRLSDRDGEVQRILVCFGGTDPTQETLKALKALDDSRFSGIHIDVATGAANPQIKTIQKLSESMNHVTVHIQAPNMAKLMAQADLAVCSGGTLTWERYCLGLPGIVIAVAKNQIKAMESLMPRGIDRYLGVSEMVTPEDIRQAVLEFMSAPASVKKSGRLAQKMVDGKGAERIADYIFGLGT